MIRKIFYIINLFCSFLLLLSYASAYVPPHVLPKLSLFSFLYPYLLFINIIFILIWLFIKWKYIIIPLACILIKVNYIPNLYKFNGTEHRTSIHNDDIKILSYNVCSFHYDTKWNEPKDKRIDSVYNYIEKLNPSIIAFQDYSSSKKKNSIHNRLVKKLGYKYFYTPINDKYNVYGNVIYSKYPIVQSGVLFPLKNSSNSYIYSDIQINRKNKIRVINLHLASYKLAEEDKQVFSKLKEEGVKTAIEKDAKPLLKKLVWANTKRSHEVDELVKIFEEKQIPTILTGDFNDTPFSYTYREFKKHLNDAFVEKGKGFGTTYNGDLPAYRIDYIFYDKNYFSAKSFERAALENSDHFPVSAVFSINKDNN